MFLTAHFLNKNYFWMVLLSLVLITSPGLADETTETETTEEVVLPSISLKYSQLYYLDRGIWDDEREVVAPLLYAQDGKLYGITSYDTGRDGGIVFRADPAGSSTAYANEDGVEILHEFEYSNRLVSNLVQVANGDIFGMARFSETDYDRDDEGNIIYEGPGLVIFKLPASEPSNLQILDIAGEEDLPYFDPENGTQTSTTLYGNLVVNPVDGHIYGLGYGSSVGATLFRIRSDGSALEIVYSFGSEDSEGNRIYYAPLSITVESNGQLALMMQGGIDKDYADENETPSGALFRLDPANPPAEGELEPIHIFTQNQIPYFSTSRFFNPPELGSGYLVDDGNGWWYGNYSGIVTRNTLYADEGTDLGGGIFRIRHDGSDFEIIHQFSNACSADTEPFVEPDDTLGLTQEEYDALTRDERNELYYEILFSNDDCHRDWPEGKMPVGPLLLNDDGLIYGTAGRGGVPVWQDEDRRPGDENVSTYKFSTSSMGTVFRLFPDYADQEGGGFQLVRPFRKPLGENYGAAIPLGLTKGNDGKLYGVSLGSASSTSVGNSGSTNLIYSLEFNAADIDMTSTATSNMEPGDEFTISWWAYQVTQCEAYSRTVEDWSGDLATSGSKTLTTTLAGNHRLEIICQNDDGSVYIEKAFTISVESPPLTEEQYLELFNYKHDGAGSFSLVLVMALVLTVLASLHRKRIYRRLKHFRDKEIHAND